MLMRSILLLVFWLTLSGCAASAENGIEEIDPDDPKNCSTIDNKRDPIVKQVNINYMVTPIKVTPPRLCVQPGDILRFKLNGNQSIKNVRVEGKEASDAWIAGSNSGKKPFFYVVVPADILPPGSDEIPYPERVFYFSVIVDDTNYDPEVRVKDNYY